MANPTNFTPLPSNPKNFVGDEWRAVFTGDAGEIVGVILNAAKKQVPQSIPNTNHIQTSINVKVITAIECLPNISLAKEVHQQ